MGDEDKDIDINKLRECLKACMDKYYQKKATESAFNASLQDAEDAVDISKKDMRALCTLLYENRVNPEQANNKKARSQLVIDLFETICDEPEE